MKKILFSMDPKKESIDNDIPAKILKGSGMVIASYMYNTEKNEPNFSLSLKEGTVIPINKKN